MVKGGWRTHEEMTSNRQKRAKGLKEKKGQRGKGSKETRERVKERKGEGKQGYKNRKREGGVSFLMLLKKELGQE